MLESGSSSLKLSAIVVDRAMRGSFFCREGQGAVSTSARAACRASLPPLSVSLGGRTPPRHWAWKWEAGSQEGHSHRWEWKQGDDKAWWG